MQKPLIIERKAEREFQQAINWYDQISGELGDRIEAEIRKALRSIKEYSKIGAEARPRIRRVILDTFPYGVFYVNGKKATRILAFIHHARDPRKWPKY